MTKPLKDKEGQSSRRRAASPPPRHHATRSRRKLQPQAEEEEILVATIQASLRKIAKDYDKSTTFHIESYASSPRTIPGGLHELEKLYHEEKAKMMADVQNLHQKTKILESKLEAAGKEITAARESENVWFSALLAKSAGDDGVTDARLIQEFGNLEGQIHALGHSDAFAPSGKPTRSHVAVPSEDEEFYLAWRSFLHMEERLVELERALKARPVAENHIADWRMATIRCIRSCQRDDRFGDDLATTMYSVFEPLILKDVELEEIELLKKELSQLCRDAVKLRFLMRGSEEHYECVTLEKGLPLSNNTDIAEKYTVWGGKYEEDCSFIRFTIFGALVHRLRHPPGARRALEKAKVLLVHRSAAEVAENVRATLQDPKHCPGRAPAVRAPENKRTGENLDTSNQNPNVARQRGRRTAAAGRRGELRV
ncbi:hypothetical protein A9K55_001484 [Cordyceps militaris]|uniref:Uncharacterized protein n=1 Tax=Cordyceps militaris TaxID=73501 RepID=A0A2H4SSV5_CORMI|nr:hypothetical protein A9K55_001484 [Cordyceps militaris]